MDQTRVKWSEFRMRAQVIPAAIASIILTVVLSLKATGAEFMFRTRVDGQMLEGKPLIWSSDHIKLLSRDGQLYEFNPKLAKKGQKTSPRFFGYSQSEMKTVLQKEFGKQFDVSATRHYLVVHPQGERDQWANRFEDLYKRFEHYFRVRGFKLTEPPYPLVAIVFRDRAEYHRYAAASGTPPHKDSLGRYALASNRVCLFDITSGAGGENWSENASTIIHEATHQTAHNVGVHNRFAAAPRWVAEGLATMFEARGVWNRQYDNSQRDRVNQYQLNSFRDYAATRRRPGAVAELIASDDAFRSDIHGAYAEAWALSFYLSETQPRLYAAYLAKTADRPLFTDYTPAERMADFQDLFGDEMKMFETKFLRYMDEVR
jgi:hypothetical protein